MVTDLSEKICLQISGGMSMGEYTMAYLEMVADQVSVLAARALDQDCPMVVALL